MCWVNQVRYKMKASWNSWNVFLRKIRFLKVTSFEADVILVDRIVKNLRELFLQLLTQKVDQILNNFMQFYCTLA